jgi:hypothetical protein
MTHLELAEILKETRLKIKQLRARVAADLRKRSAA